MATIDNLVIEISADTKDAESKIKGLSSALNSLKKASSIKGEKLEKVADGFNAIKRACSGIKESTISKVERLADALERVGNANVGNISRALRNFEAKVPKTSTEKTRRDFHPPAIRDDTFKTPEIIKQLPAMYEDTFKEAQMKMNSLVPTWEKVEPFETPPEASAGSWRELGESVSYAGNEIDKTGKEMKTTITYSFNLGKALGVLGKLLTDSALTTIALPFKALGSAIKNLIAPIGSFIRSIGRIALYRAIRSAIKGISQGFKEGLENLAMFSKLRNELDTHSANKVLSEYTSNFLYLKNALATAVIPILKMLQPVVASVTNSLIDFINVLAQFFSFLSGADTFTKAKYYYQDYADSLGKASGNAEKLNKQLAKFDEINNLTTKDASGSGNTPDYLEMFEDPVPIAEWIKNLKNMDFKQIGETIAGKIRDSLGSIDWKDIYGKATKLGSGFASFLNGLIDPETFGVLGKTLAGGIMTAIKFAFEFGKDFDWENLGNSIAEGINNFFAEFDGGELGATLGTWIDGVETTFKTAVKKIKWKEVFKDLFDFFSHLGIDNILLVLGAVTVIKGLNWAVTVGQSVINGIITAISSQIGTITLGKLTIDASSKFALMGLGLDIGAVIVAGIIGAFGLNFVMQVAGLIKGAFTGDYSMFELYRDTNPLSKTFEKLATGETLEESESYQRLKDKGAIFGTRTKGGSGGRGKSSPFQNFLKTVGAFSQFNILGAKGGNAIANSIIGGNAFQSALNKGKINKNSTFFEMGKAMGEEIILGIVAGIGTKVKTIMSFPAVLTSFTKAFKTTFDSHSHAKKMYPIGEDIILGIIKGFYLVNFGQEMAKWWTENVSPWFTVERWRGVADGVRAGIISKWNETVISWSGKISSWWTNNVSPWFTLDRWKTVADGIRAGLVAKWNEIALWWQGAINGIVTKAKNILNYDSFYSIGSKIGSGLKNAFSTFINEMERLWKGLKDTVSAGLSLTIKVGVNDNGFNSALANWQSKVNSLIGSISQLNLGDVQPTNLGEFDTRGKGGEVVNPIPEEVKEKTWHNLPTVPSAPDYIKDYSARQSWMANWLEDWKKNHPQNFYAGGGYPIQGSLFVAGESGAELVGNINGRTGVANTDQITEAIYTASYNGMSKALAENGMNVTIEGDTNKIFRVVRKDAREFYNQNGFSPFPV